MKSIYVLMHQKKPNAAEVMVRLANAFERAGIRAAAEPWLYRLSEREGKELFFSDRPEGCEAIVSVGGDGTLLRAHTLAMEKDLPVLGVNLGRIGFLTEIEMDQLEAACQKLAQDDFTIRKRMMLEATIQGRSYWALNDVVVSRGGYSRLLGVEAWVDQDSIGRFRADGMIIATPTGSTGYSLSAGGPIICPEVECMLLTPVCAHSLQHRPVVAPASQTVSIRLLDPEMKAVISVDGGEGFPFETGQTLTVRRSARKARLIRLEPANFFSKLRIKLSEWSC